MTSAIVFKTPLAPILLVALMFVVFVVTWQRLEYGLVAAFAELFSNSHGHLLHAEIGDVKFSLRMGIFVAVMLAYAIRSFAKRSSLPSLHDGRLSPFLGVLLAAVYGVAIGLPAHATGDVFADGNAYIFILYILPILAVSWNGASRQLLLQTLAAGATWAAALTVGLLFVFTHLSQDMLAATYTFIRDTRTGELTRFPNGLFRIFLQAQFSVVVVWLLVAVYRLFARTEIHRGEGALQALALAALLMGLSRSFWVGVGAALFFVIAIAFGKKLVRATHMVKHGLLQGVWLIGAVAFLFLVILFPFPKSTVSWDSLGTLLSSRATDLDDVAVSSRWNLLPPLLEEIKEQPLFGKGFGEEVRFITDDPRARAISPDGTWSTYALEWGWLEIWLKMGIFGIAAFVWVFVASCRGLLAHLKDREPWIGVASIAALIMLFVAHFFSPYLNHPLGLGLLLFFVPFWKLKTPAERVAEETAPAPAIQPSVAPLTSE